MAEMVWCKDCSGSHECDTDHGPDGHGGSAICCPIKRAEPTPVVESWRSVASQLMREAADHFEELPHTKRSDDGPEWHNETVWNCDICDALIARLREVSS